MDYVKKILFFYFWSKRCANGCFCVFLSGMVDKLGFSVYYIHVAVMAQAVEHVLGKDEVTSSNLVNSSI